MEIIPEFEYEVDKSAANFAKHGIDFEHVQVLWQDDRALEIRAWDVPESRWLRVGSIEGKHWTAVFTMRDAKIRLISARRARTRESKAYGTQDG